jgi:large subunit ribosomal protein L32e
MTSEIKRLIQVRVDKGAVFKRDGYGKKRQLSDSWRKPRGQHNKQREQKKAKGALPKPGFGSPVAVRGMHPSGFFEILISSAKELEGFDPKTHAVRIRATVGERNRVGLQEKAQSEGFKVLNARIVKTEPKQEKIDTEKEAETEKKEEKKSAKARVAGLFRKDTKKVKKTPETEEKKAPVKEKKPAKSKSKKSADTPEKTQPAESAKSTRKSAKPKTKSAEAPEKTNPAVSTKSTKKSVKPKTEAPVEATPPAAPKTKAKKKTESEVKKNE